VILGPGDEERFLAYCDAHPDETIWLRSAWYEGNARFAMDAGLAAHDRKGVIHVHHASPELAREVVRDGWPIAGIAGPPEELDAARAALGLAGREVAHESHEILMALSLDELVPPELLAQPGVVVRRAGPTDLPLLLDWRTRYFREVHRIEPDEEAFAELREHLGKGRMWLLEDGGQVVNTACFSEVFPEILQIEYAYGPKELRAKKYGRSVVAGALIEARREGVKRAVFNTDENNLAVQTGIQPIGFRTVGRYWVLLFR
jgi:hypothetical protein